VESDDLVAEDVLAGSDVFGNSDSPGIAVGNQVVGSPVLGSGIIDALLVDLEEGKVTSRGGSAVVAGALGQVVEDRTVVRLRPGVPLKLDGATGSDRSDLGTRLTALWSWLEMFK
jgi:hypothetical protein